MHLRCRNYVLEIEKGQSGLYLVTKVLVALPLWRLFKITSIQPGRKRHMMSRFIRNTMEEMEWKWTPSLYWKYEGNPQAAESTAPGADRITYAHWRQLDPERQVLTSSSIPAFDIGEFLKPGRTIPPFLFRRRIHHLMIQAPFTQLVSAAWFTNS